MFSFFRKRNKSPVAEEFITVSTGKNTMRVDRHGVCILADRQSFCVNPEYEAYLCKGHSPYSRLDDIFELNHYEYFPSIYIHDTRDEAFANAYDQRAIERGDRRRAWRCDMRKNKHAYGIQPEAATNTARN